MLVRGALKHSYTNTILRRKLMTNKLQVNCSFIISWQGLIFTPHLSATSITTVALSAVSLSNYLVSPVVRTSPFCKEIPYSIPGAYNLDVGPDICTNFKSRSHTGEISNRKDIFGQVGVALFPSYFSSFYLSRFYIKQL